VVLLLLLLPVLMLLSIDSRSHNVNRILNCNQYVNIDMIPFMNIVVFMMMPIANADVDDERKLIPQTPPPTPPTTTTTSFHLNCKCLRFQFNLTASAAVVVVVVVVVRRNTTNNMSTTNNKR